MAFLQGTNGDDTLNGQAENDTLVGYAGADRLDGGGGDDLLASDRIGSGGRGTPIAIDPTADADTLSGGNGDDHLLAGYNDSVDGGAGTNLLSIDLSGAVGGATFRFLTAPDFSISTSTTNGAGVVTNVAALTYVRGGAAADDIRLTQSAAVGRTTVEGFGGNDYILVGSGTDYVSGGDGDDYIGSFGAALTYGDGGRDRISSSAGLVYGGDGDDELSVSSPIGGVVPLAGLPTLYGGAGNDRLFAGDSGYADGIVLYGEAGDDALTSGRGADTLYGGDGDDYLGDSSGSAGADVLIGGLGNDRYFSRTGARIIEAENEGTDIVYVTDYTYALGKGVSVELLTYFDPTRSDAVTLTGNSFSQEVVGDQGGNLLTGSGLATLAPDTLRGLGGNDTLIGNGGNDRLEGDAGNDVLIANAGDDTVLGGAGDDTLNGGIGRDRLEGGAGNDVYLVDTGQDVIVEAVGGGSADTVYAVNNHALGDAEIENFAAATATSAAGIFLQGNQYGQAIAGDYGNNIIIGGGSSVNGGDILIGLRGDDLYTVDAPNILIFEAFGAAEGNDTATILASGSGFTLNGDSYVETLQALPGNANINITGNFAAQRIAGNDGNNFLSTGGGGADTLDGGLGDDTYRVHGTVAILDHGGNDAIYTSGTFRLFSNAGAELITTAVQAGTEAIDITGNEVAQTVIGNFGANTLDGRGGNDTLIGLQGADTFAFTSALGAGNVDTIQDFASGTDRIGLANDVFAGVISGGIAANEFVLGTAATTADTRLIYNQASGQLSYDADANGAGAAVLFAQLGAGTVLTAADFVAVAPTVG